MANENTALCIFNNPTYVDQFTSFKPDGLEGKKQLFNCINSPDGRLADFINKTINVRDVIVKKVTMTAKSQPSQTNAQWAEDDAQEKEGFRVILIDTGGKSYTATSQGIYNSIATLMSIFGTLHFDDGLPMEVKQVSTKNGNTLTLNLV